VAKRLAPNHRVLCAAPGYLAAAGTPSRIEDLSRHTLITHNADHWRLDGPGGPVTVRVNGPLRTNSSEVVREALLAGLGIALRSTWDVGPELKSGALQRVLPEYSVGRRVAVHAVYPSRRHMEQKVRAFVDYLGELYGQTPYWDAGLNL
jgi:DNA-binding transcriptional LysR family regulator